MNPGSQSGLTDLMREAVLTCLQHVERGGLPFVGVVVDRNEMISTYGVNQVAETGDPAAHAEIVAMREVMAHGNDLSGAVLLATGEPCGLCYRFALDHGIARIYVAVDRDEVAAWGFDYRHSYPQLGITDQQRAEVFQLLPVESGTEPFARYLQLR